MSITTHSLEFVGKEERMLTRQLAYIYYWILGYASFCVGLLHLVLKTHYRNLREMFKIDAADYMMSICGNDALRELSSPGKSGSIFFLSQDDRFMIKTLRKSEVKVCHLNLNLVHLLSVVVAYCTQTLSQFCSLNE